MIISKLITHYRNCLNQQPESILIGEIPEGASNFNENLDFFLTPAHKEFLTLCDGGSFGDILLWGSDELLDQQYRVPDSLKDDMYEIGHILYEPLFLDRRNNTVFYSGENYDGINEIAVIFSEFVSDYIFGDKYKQEIIGESSDEWSEFLSKNPIE